MNEVENILKHYYNNYDEDSRLVKDKAHSIEFITTTKYIEKYLKKGDRILEIGAGTGRYSLHYAQKGYQVDSVELIENNIEKLKSKIKSDMKIEVKQGNAMDLHMYKDDTFDITLCLGPIYHLFTEEDKRKAIAEAIRVTKHNGMIYFAFITNEAVILSYGLKKGNLEKIAEITDEEFKVKDLPEEIFSVNRVKEFNEIMKEYNVEFLHNVATEGISNHLAEYINKLNENEYKIWINFHLATAERNDLIGYSSHVLYICKKSG